MGPKRAGGRPGGRICDAGYYFVYVECTAPRRERSVGPTKYKTCSFLYGYLVAMLTHLEGILGHLDAILKRS